MKRMEFKLTRQRAMEIGIALGLVLVMVLWAAVLQWTDTERDETAARKRMFAIARVTDVLEDDAEVQDWTEGRRIGQQYLEVELLNGEWKGLVLETVNYLTIYTNVDAHVGTKIVVRLDLDDNGEPYIISVPNYDRATMLNLMIGLNGYTLCSGIICEELNGTDYLAVPFDDTSVAENSVMEIGYITKRNAVLSTIGTHYIEEIQKYLQAQ